MNTKSGVNEILPHRTNGGITFLKNELNTV